MALADILLKGARGARVPQSFLPLLQQAISEAAVRYEPEYQQLNALREQSAGTMRQRISQANSAAQLQSALANEAFRNVNANTNPLVQRAAQYQGTQGSTGQIGTGLALGLGATSSLLAQAAANAPIRAQQQGIQALGEHQSDLEKINSQRSGLIGQAGTYITGRYGDLTQTDRSNRAKVNAQKRQIATSLKTAGIDSSGQVVKGGPKDPAITHPPKPPAGPSTIAKPPANYPGSPADWNNASRADRERWLKNHPTGKGGTTTANPGGVKLAPPATQAAQVAKINGAFANVKTLMSHPQAVKGEVETLLRAGKVDGVKYTQDQIDVAFDRFRNNGRISNRGARKLHTMGVSVRGHYQNAGSSPRPVIGPPAAGPAGPLS